MNRKDFFKKIGLTSVAIAVAPKLLAGNLWDKTPVFNNYIELENEFYPNTSDITWLKLNYRGDLLVNVKNHKIFHIGDIVIMDSDNRRFIISYKDSHNDIGIEKRCIFVLGLISGKKIKDISSKNKLLRKIGNAQYP